VQDGKTPLIRACINKDEVMAALLMEATKKAGALDAQVTEQAWGGVSGVRGAGRYLGGLRMWVNGERRRLEIRGYSY
jgi:hypothetical protein